MTHTPPDNKAVAAGNGFAGGPGVPVLDVDDVSKSYPGEPPSRPCAG